MLGHGIILHLELLKEYLEHNSAHKMNHVHGSHEFIVDSGWSCSCSPFEYDFESLEDNTVTIRERDSLQQERISIDKIEEIVRERVDMKHLFVQPNMSEA